MSEESEKALVKDLREVFATTSWTIVLAAGGDETPESFVALEKLCSTYWFPIYAYIRRRGHSKEDAEDLTQGFFSRFLERNYFKDLDATRGRFRGFLLAALKNYLANEWDRAQCIKRGGKVEHLRIDWGSAEAQFELAASAGQNPDALFDREWALTLLTTVFAQLGKEYAQDNRAQEFETLRTGLATGKGSLPHASAAKILGIAEGAARSAAYRLRRKYRQALRQEIAQTLRDPTKVEEELRALFHSLVAW